MEQEICKVPIGASLEKSLLHRCSPLICYLIGTLSAESGLPLCLSVCLSVSLPLDISCLSSVVFKGRDCVILIAGHCMVLDMWLVPVRICRMSEAHWDFTKGIPIPGLVLSQRYSHKVAHGSQRRPEQLSFQVP